MNILMTGAGGYIGRNFINYFSENSSEDTLTLLTSKSISGYECIPYHNLEFNTDDINAPIDCVFLLGAFVEHHGRNEQELVRKHLSSINSLDYLLHHLPNVPNKVVYCSSISVYGIDSSLPYQSGNGVLMDENTKIDPIRTYSLSKVFGERLVTEWCNEHDVKCQIVRIGTVYDYSGQQNNFLGYLIDAINKDQIFNVSAPLGQLWNFVYIEDICRWLLNAIKIEDTPGVINLTSSENHTTDDIISIIRNYYDSFKYTIPECTSFRGVDKGFRSIKRETYLGAEINPLSVSLPNMLSKYSFND